MRPIKIWQVVKELESQKDDVEKELDEARATMLVNFGGTGRTEKGLCHSSDKLATMIMKVFQHYHNIIHKR